MDVLAVVRCTPLCVVLVLCGGAVVLWCVRCAQVNFDDNAAFRQKELFALRDYTQEDKREVEADRGSTEPPDHTTPHTALHCMRPAHPPNHTLPPAVCSLCALSQYALRALH